MNGIHHQFIVTPTDKANGNVAIICQQFYALVLIKELGLDHDNSGTNKNYIPVHKTNYRVISGHTTFLWNKFNWEVDEGNKKLPNIYWTPKLHKHSSTARFIIAAPQRSVKPLSKAVTLVLKLMYKQMETYSPKNVLLFRD